MKCPFCGMENEDGSMFCMNCGKEMSSASAAEPENVSQTAQTEDTFGSFNASASGSYNSQTTTGSYVSQASSGEYYASADAVEEKPKKKKNKVVIIVVVIVALLLLCCCGSCIGTVMFTGIMASEETEVESSVEDFNDWWETYEYEESSEDISVSDDTQEATESEPEESTVMDASDIVEAEGYFDGYQWRASDDSVLTFADGSFEWYLDETVTDDNYYKGAYTVYTGDNALGIMAVNEASWGITQDEVQQFFEENEGDSIYNKDNLVVMIFSNEDNMYEGEVMESSETPYYGFVSIADEYIDIVNINTGNYMNFVFESDDEEQSSGSTDINADADWKDLSFYLDGQLMTWPLTLEDFEQFGFGLPEDLEGETLDAWYYIYSYPTTNADDETIYLGFKNYTDTEGRTIEDCLIREFGIDDYYDLPEFSLANGLTIGSTLEQVEEVMGEADYVYDSDSSTYKVRSYYVDPDDAWTDEIEFTFYDGVVSEINIVNDQDE